MKKRLLFAALFSAALVSCTKDQVVEVQQDEIKFRVATENATKADAVYCNYKLMPSFNVSAIYTENITGAAGKVFIPAPGDLFTASGSPVEWTNENVRYWPNNGKLDFYASYNGTMSIEGATVKFADFSVEPYVPAHKDLLYAAKSAQEKTTSAVTLNFRHALSQIVFKARNSNKNLYVEIEDVSVNNLASKNTFTFPANTDTNVDDHDQSGTTTFPANTQGTWGTASVVGTDYKVAFLPAVRVPGDESFTTSEKSVNLTDVADASSNWDNVMLLLPQTITSWVPTSGVPATDNAQTGSFFMLKCRIYNVVDETIAWANRFEESNLVLVWGDAGATTAKSDDVAKEVAIPVPAIEWKQGQKYVYTFVFDTESNGGLDPTDPTKPVLVPIQLAVTVDDFTNINEDDVEMNQTPAVVPVP